MWWRRITGDWVPGGFPRWVTLIIELTLFYTATVRGFDYGMGDSEHVARNLSVVEQTMPIEQWGVLFLASGATGFAGMVLRRSRLIFGAHLLSALLYASLGSGIAEVAMHRGFDGIRNANVLIGIAIIHIFFAIGTHLNIRKKEHRATLDCKGA